MPGLCGLSCLIKSSPIFLCNSTPCTKCGCCETPLQVAGDKPACQQPETRASKSRCQQLQSDHGSLDPHTCSAITAAHARVTGEGTTGHQDRTPKVPAAGGIWVHSRQVRVSAMGKETVDHQACRTALLTGGPRVHPYVWAVTGPLTGNTCLFNLPSKSEPEVGTVTQDGHAQLCSNSKARQTPQP